MALVCEDPQSWATYMRQLRSSLGWSQSHLASAMGLTPSAVAHYEGGRRIPTRDACRRLGEVLTRESGLTPDQDPFLMEDMP
jgi:transcriptional regulator with XRE-family HTH domain